jgi:CubicO group peptidase (beta-lactamase class C family)
MPAVRTLTLALCLVATALTTHAQPTSPVPNLTDHQIAAIDQFVNSEMARQHIPGLEVGIYSRGRILLAKGYGLADVELNVPVKPETIFQSGSVGKQFVSAAIMMLVEEHRLSLDDSITKYFPEAPATWKPILIRNLLSHTSGLSEYETDERTAPTGPFYLRLDFTEDELTKKIEAMPIEWPPGDKWAYRNTNYVVLGILIHKITGKPYAQFLDERIFKPLGMTSTRLISDRDIIYNRASGYELVDGQLKNQEWASPTFNSTADGALYFNVLDLAKWDEALYTTRLLSQASLDLIWTPYKLNDGKPNFAGYGFAWGIHNFHGHKLIEHSGEWQGFTCHIARYADDSLTTVVLTNLAGADPGIIAHVVAGLVSPPLLPNKLLAIPDNDPSIAVSVRSLLDQIADGTDIRSQIAADLAGLVTSEDLASRRKMLAPLWPGGTLTLVKRHPADDARDGVISTYRLTKGHAAILVTYGRKPDGKIDDLRIYPDQVYE